MTRMMGLVSMSFGLGIRFLLLELVDCKFSGRVVAFWVGMGMGKECDMNCLVGSQKIPLLLLVAGMNECAHFFTSDVEVKSELSYVFCFLYPD